MNAPKYVQAPSDALASGITPLASEVCGGGKASATITDLATRVIAAIKDECDWPMRYPPLPEIAADTELGANWFGPVDCVCIQMRLDEDFDIEIPSTTAEKWASVADIIATVSRLAGEPVS